MVRCCNLKVKCLKIYVNVHAVAAVSSPLHKFVKVRLISLFGNYLFILMTRASSLSFIVL